MIQFVDIFHSRNKKFPEVLQNFFLERTRVSVKLLNTVNTEEREHSCIFIPDPGHS